ncbi:hypothetical protein HYALB_00006477 [Hymenoscyphus albidus]|uniref:Uncharacterized protein n=1 Tax=Hymenoscyphus albidus TaxID=595503 RepID=A0A9N9LIY9_9HELO|nr:hypothetical protein HYALB_00006477 [Hymenoscyphus albidus]
MSVNNKSFFKSSIARPSILLVPDIITRPNMFFNYLFAATLLTSVTAVPQLTATPNNFTKFFQDSDYSWNVTDWTARYENFRTSATYSFNIQGPDFGPNPIVPKFNATCSGKDEGGKMAPCTFTDSDAKPERNVSARLMPQDQFEPFERARIVVSYQFRDTANSSIVWRITNGPTEALFFKANQTFTIDNIEEVSEGDKFIG